MFPAGLGFKAKGRSMALLLTLLLAVSLHAPSDSSMGLPHEYGKSSLSVNLGGPTYALSLAFGQYMSDKLESEIGLGFLGVYGGLKYHLLYRNIGQEGEFISPYTGLLFSYGAMIDTTSSYFIFPPFRMTTALFLPLGIQCHGREHFQFAAEVAVVKLFYNTHMFKRDLFL
jgi:hypothetical protein